jgi:prophage regulatory protein
MEVRMEKLLLKPTEVAEIIGLGRSKTYELIAKGSVPSVRIGKCVRVPVDGLREWVRLQTVNNVAESELTI